MKMFKLNSRLTRRVAATVALGLLLGAQTAMACTVVNWNGGNSGNVTAGGPGNNVSRYSGVCAMQTPSGTMAWVQDNSPGGIDRIRARFYVFSGNTADSIVYRGLAAGGAEMFRVVLRGNGAATLSSNGATVTAPGNDDAWNSVEIDWNGPAGEMTLSMNGNTPAVTAFTSPGPIESVRVGNLNGAAGVMNFDAYESRRTTEIGRLCRGNPEGDGQRDIGDLQVLFTEIQSLGGTPAPGTPDANEDGSVGLADLNVIFGLIQSLQGDCSAFPG